VFDRDDLQAALAARIFEQKQVEAFERLITQRQADSSTPTRAVADEELRFLRNFNDLFLSIGLSILLAGISAGLTMSLGGWLGEGEGLALSVAALSAAITWALAEYFTGRRRLLLPGITLAVAFVIFVTIAAGVALMQVLPDDDASGPAAIAVAATLAALAYYARFRLPFSLGLTAVTIAVGVFVSLASVGAQGAVYNIALLLMGLATLAAAIWFDQKDPARVTRYSDTGFWLHMAAAPQVVGGALGLAGANTYSLFASSLERSITGSASGPNPQVLAATVVVIILVLALTALALNRRALMVSGLISFGTALGVLFSGFGLDGGTVVVVTLLALGLFATLLGGGWSTARRALLALLPRAGVWGRIFPPEPARIVSLGA
jgi:hypothetical protein